MSTLLQAPYLNTFGSTETGMAPAAGTRFAIGHAPTDLGKAHNSLYRSRLVGPDDRDVTPGEPGEMAVRGPTVFSGYWKAEAVNAKEFRGGWFHMGDLFVEGPDGRVHFVDRSKYLIKSGGENIYPSEIERVLMNDPRAPPTLGEHTEWWLTQLMGRSEEQLAELLAAGVVQTGR